jgi:hypothetical protein
LLEPTSFTGRAEIAGFRRRFGTEVQPEGGVLPWPLKITVSRSCGCWSALATDALLVAIVIDWPGSCYYQKGAPNLWRNVAEIVAAVIVSCGKEWVKKLGGEIVRHREIEEMNRK